MPSLFGPILTTGVALSAAVVVVTNPVTAPNADVAIPAAAVSAGTGQAVDMLDENFIKAVGPDQQDSTSPLSVLKDLVSALVADAADLGKSAVLHAFAAGANVVSRPELTAASHPYIPSVPWTAVPGPVPEDLQPVVQQALADIISNAGEMADADVLAAAISAGVALGTDPAALLESLRGVVSADVQPVVDSGVSALAGLPHPEVGDAVRAAVQQYLHSVPSVADVAALPSRWANPGQDLSATGSPADDSELSGATPRRPIVERALTAAGSIAKSSSTASPVAKAISPKRRLGGIGRLGSVLINGPHRQASSDAAGVIGRAVKARADRTSN